MARQSSTITLPWVRRGDTLIAELGARFVVESRDGGWQCSMENGECVEVLGKNLKTQRAGKARAAEHATRMAAAALGKGEKPAGAKGRGRRPAREPAQEEKAAPVAPPPAPPRSRSTDTAAGGVPFDVVEDGCLMGRAGGACGVANEREVVFSKDVDPKVRAEVEQAAASYYSDQRKAEEATKAAARAEREAARAAAKAERAAARAAAKAERAAARAAKKTAKAAGKKTAKAGKKTAKAGKKTAGAGKKAEAEKTTVGATTKATAATVGRKAAKKAAKKGPRGRKGKAAGKDAAKEEEAVKGKAAKKTCDEKTCDGKVCEKAKPASSGPITWSNKDGELRGTAAHGVFVVQAEGQRHALYFHDPSGQSRYLQSGTLCDVRKAAEEMAARGQPTPPRDKLTPEMEEQMVRMFVTGAVGGATP